ncbi:hypothetical protein EW145_g1028 [Phellinidium pouzarii]|uniref:Cystathionine beta-lyase n=1 Tax=Phellinidium pouzarii TaxID=167371 RepID=A0A4S4LGM9_9AGAM|nr:hypothetical protein EW145_g1028 [Phellinidium pouzarii]
MAGNFGSSGSGRLRQSRNRDSEEGRAGFCQAPSPSFCLFSTMAAPFDLPTPGPDSPRTQRKPYRFATLCATVENPDMKDQYSSSSVPIYQSATFKGVAGEFDYSRSGNPTRSHLEHHLAKMSSAEHAFAVSSGMAAMDVITRLLKPGDEIIAGDDLYGGTNRLLGYLISHGGVIVHHVDTTKAESIHPYVKAGKTAMVLLESPTNPLLKIADLAKISADVKERAPEAIVVVDNTMMSPYLQRPLEHGADIVYDSATKYLSGHHDLMAGVITCNRDDLGKKMAFTINSIGNGLSPFDAFLLLRGTKTLAVRMDRQQKTAMAVATMLDHLGFVVHYPGLQNHPGREVHERIASGAGAVLSFTTGDKALSERIVGATRLWGISVSFGCVNSLISMPCVMSHASIDPATRAARGLPEDLIRLCVGIEDSVDLLDDLEHALLDAGAITLEQGIDGHHYVRASLKREGHAISRAIEKLALNEPEERFKDQREWFVSAPGKVILFGEHAVVHGVTALAASVDLRCYGLTTPRHDKKISVHFADLGGYSHEWDIDSLPWSAASPISPGSNHPDTLDAELIDAISTYSLPVATHDVPAARNAALTFLYLYMSLAHDESSRPALHFSARSMLPVGAGLGSSASFSSCAASALLLVLRRVSVPHLPAPATEPTHPGDPGHVHISHQGRRALPSDLAEEINRWAFVAEKVLHGNPSGVDNCVSVFGGALAYTRPGFGKKSGMEAIHGFKSLRFLLIDTKIPRNTKALVAGVALKKENEPDHVGNILTLIQNISDEARRILADPELARDIQLDAVGKLIIENHAHLRELGVSHPALEAVKEKTSAYGLQTKLTGAGGGGCAVTLVPDNFSEDQLKQLMSELLNDGFVPYLTSVGGSGIGILSPYGTSATPSVYGALATPPETPKVSGSLTKDAPLYFTRLQHAFDAVSAVRFADWAEQTGRWLYV